MYTTASLIFKALADAGITHAFVNWGNDHPAFLEELERERVESGKTFVEIVTCPHEMVALSAAQGYAQVTGKPAAVIVHVDVGTQVSSMNSVGWSSEMDTYYSHRLFNNSHEGFGRRSPQCRPRTHARAHIRRCSTSGGRQENQGCKE